MSRGRSLKEHDLPVTMAGGGAVVNVSGGGGGSTNADTVDGFHAAAVPMAGRLLALDAAARFPASVIDWASVAGVGLQESPADKLAVKLDTNSGLAVSASGLKLSFGGGSPTAIEPDNAAGQGTQPYAARADHRHAITAAAPGTIQPDHTASEGTSTSFARADHQHAIGAAAPTAALSYASTNAEGASTSFSRADHGHAITAYSDASVYPGHLLKSDVSGDIKVHMLTATDRLRATLIDSPTGTGLSIAPAEDISLSPGNTKRVKATTGVRLQSDGYVSQTTGWAIAFNGAADFRYIYTDELHAKAFIADLEQALAGGQIISKSVAPLSRDFTAPAAGGTAYLWVECFQGFPAAQVFAAGDVVMVRNFDRSGGGLSITNCFGTVSSPYFPTPQSDPPEQRWTFTRLSGTVNGHPAAGYMMANSVVKRGALALDFGVSGNGYHEVNAIDGDMGENSPYNQTVKWATHPWYDRTVTTRTGNLKGIFNVANEYGLYAGEGVTDASKYLRVSNQAIEGHNLPIRLYDGATQVVRIEPGTYPYIGLGNPAPTGYLGATGIWMGKHSSAYKMHVGTISGGDVTAGWKWDGTTLVVKGQVLIKSGSSGIANLSDAGALAVKNSVDLATGEVTNKYLDNIADGTTYKRTTATQRDGGGYAYTGLRSDGLVKKRIYGAYIDTATPVGAGLNLTSSYMGYHDGTAWKAYIANDGKFLFKGDNTNYLQWDGTTLTVKGQIYVTGGDAAKTDLSNVADNTVVDKVNAGSTLITPGRILVSGSTTLADWRHPSDQTLIDGGDIYANSVTASQMAVVNANLVSDWSFEYGGAGWTINNGASIAGFGSHTGTHSLAGDGGRPASYVYARQDIPIQSGATYYVEVWCYVSSGTRPTGGVIRWLDASGATLSSSFFYGTTTGSMVRHSVLATAPSGAATAQVQLSQWGDVVSGAAPRWDDVVFRPASGMNLLVGTPGSARVEINNEGIEGYSDATTKQFYLRTSDGRAMFGGGKGVLDSDGMVLSGNETSYNSYNAVRWLTQVDPPGGSELARVAAGRWVFVSPNYYPELRLHANPTHAFGGGLVNIAASKDASNYLQFTMLLTSVDRLITLSIYDGGAQTAKIELKTAGGSGQITIKPNTEIQGSLLATGNIRTKGAYFDVDNNRVVYSRYVNSYFSGGADSTYSSNEQNLLNAIRDCLIWHGLAAAS